MPSLRNLADRSLTDLPRTEKTKGVIRALREILVRDEIDKAFRRYGPALAHIEEVFPDGRSKPRRQ